MKKFAYLFPGQGAQYVGMGKDFYETFPIAKEVFEEADDILKSSLSKLIFEGPLDQLTLTRNSQPAIFVTSIAILRVLSQQFPSLKPSVCAGLSLGEYSALVAAEKVSFAKALTLVALRGQLMDAACSEYPGSMRVVLGMKAEDVEQIVGQLQKKYRVWVANINCPGQVVIAGVKDDLERVTEEFKSRGAKRVLPLNVAGAFHSELMQSAQEKLSPAIKQAPFSESSIDLVMNVPGNYVSSLDEMHSFLIDQVTKPVRWEAGVRAIDAKGVDHFIEIGCGTTLSGMNRKIGVKSETLSVDKVADLEKLEALACNC